MAILQAASLLALVALAAAQCPPEFTAYGNNACYLPVAEKRSWEEAERFCNSYSSCSSGKLAHLASIHTEMENNFVTMLYNSLYFQQPEQFWIGYNDRQTQGTFVWSDGWTYEPSAQPFTKFITPPNAFTPGDCTAVEGNMALQNMGMWQVTDCSRRLAFICIAEDEPSMECPAFPGQSRPV